MRQRKLWRKALLGVALSVWMTSMAWAAPTVNWQTQNFSAMPSVETGEKDTLLFSDSPEYVTQSGILASGTIQGQGRVYFYHVNNTGTDQKIAVVMQNTGKGPATVQIQREIMATPSTDYFAVGSQLSRKELEMPATSTTPWRRPVQEARSFQAAGYQLPDTWVPAQTNVTPGVIGYTDATPVQTDKKKDKNKKATSQVATPQLPGIGGYALTLAPGAQTTIFKALNTVDVQQDELFSGLIDFYSNEPVGIKVLMMPKNADPMTYAQIATPLSMDDVALRGTYFGARRQLQVTQTYDPADGGAFIELGNDREDPFLMGRDELSNQNLTDKGNYGVSYQVVMHTEGTDKYDVFFNPQGGSYAGSFMLSDGLTNTIYNVPNNGNESLGDGTIYDTQYLGTYQAGHDLVISFMPAGASNLPIKFLFYPAQAAKLATSTVAAPKTQLPVTATSETSTSHSTSAVQAENNALSQESAEALKKLQAQSAAWSQAAAAVAPGMVPTVAQNQPGTVDIVLPSASTASPAQGLGITISVPTAKAQATSVSTAKTEGKQKKESQKKENKSDNKQVTTSTSTTVSTTASPSTSQASQANTPFSQEIPVTKEGE